MASRKTINVYPTYFSECFSRVLDEDKPCELRFNSEKEAQAVRLRFYKYRNAVAHGETEHAPRACQVSIRAAGLSVFVEHVDDTPAAKAMQKAMVQMYNEDVKE